MLFSNNLVLENYINFIKDINIYTLFNEGNVRIKDKSKMHIINYYSAGSDEKLNHWIRAKLYDNSNNSVNYKIYYSDDGKTHISLSNNSKNYSNSQKKFANDYIRLVGAVSTFGKNIIENSFNGKYNDNKDLENMGKEFNKLSKKELKEYIEKVVIE